MEKENMTNEEMNMAIIDLMGGDWNVITCTCGNSYYFGDHGELNPGILGCIPLTGSPEPWIHKVGGLDLSVVSYTCECGKMLVAQVWSKKLDIHSANIIVNEKLEVTPPAEG